MSDSHLETSFYLAENFKLIEVFYTEGTNVNWTYHAAKGGSLEIMSSVSLLNPGCDTNLPLFDLENDF